MKKNTKKKNLIGKYEVIRTIGKGGMGTVYHCLDPDLNRMVAIKVLSKSRGIHEAHGVAERFLREAMTTARLQHPGVPPVYEVGKNEDGSDYYVMKYIDGTSLEKILQKLRDEDGDTTEEYDLFRLIEVLRDVCQTIEYAHSRGHIHRDIKPSNIFVGDYGEVYVIDWGLTKALKMDPRDKATESTNLDSIPDMPIDTAITQTLQMEDEKKDNGDSLIVDNLTRTLVMEDLAPSLNQDQLPGKTLTMQGNVLGTAQYMAPEQAMGKINSLGRQTDVYALGVILYEILTLELPVEGRSLKEILHRKVGCAIEPPEFKTLGREVPSELSTIAMQAMNPNPDDRFKSVRDFTNALEYWLEGKSQYHQINNSSLKNSDFNVLSDGSGTPWRIEENAISTLPLQGEIPSALLYKREFLGDVRFSVNVIAFPTDETSDDISEFALVVNAAAPEEDWEGYLDGYSVHFGAGKNTRAMIARHDVEVLSNEYVMLEPGRRYSLTVEKNGDSLKIFLNRQMILFHKDTSLPPGMLFGFINKGPNVVFSDVRIRTKGVSTQVSANDVPEALMAERCYAGALKRFLAIYQGNRNRRLGAWACYRAGIASYMLKRDRTRAVKIWSSLKKSPYAIFEKLGRMYLEIEDKKPLKAVAIGRRTLASRKSIAHLEEMADIVFYQAQLALRQKPRNHLQWKIIDSWSRLALMLGRRLDSQQSITQSILWRWVMLVLTMFPKELPNCVRFLRKIFGEGHGGFAENLTTIEPLMTILKRSASMTDHEFLISKIMRLILNHDDNLGNLETLVRFYLHSGHLDMARKICHHINSICQKHNLPLPPGPIAFIACESWLKESKDAISLIQAMMIRSSEWARPDGRLLLGLEHYRKNNIEKAHEHWQQLARDPEAKSYNRHLMAKGLLGELPSDPVAAKVPNRSDHRGMYYLFMGFRYYLDWRNLQNEEAKTLAQSLLRKALDSMRPSYDIYSATDLFARIPLERLGVKIPPEKNPAPLSAAEEEWLDELAKAADDDPEKPKKNMATSRYSQTRGG